MQLRKVINLQGNHTVFFRNGDQQQIPVSWAHEIIAAYDNFPRPYLKDDFQQKISYSYANLEAALA